MHVGKQHLRFVTRQSSIRTPEASTGCPRRLSGSHISRKENVVEAPEKGRPVMAKAAWKRRVFKVMAQSVFSTTGWVQRDITPEELMDVYDV